MSEFDPYPKVESPDQPFGIFVLVQMKKPQTKTKGGIILSDDTRDTEQYQVDKGIVKAVGSMAFHYRESGKSWPGNWPQIGDEVRVPMYGGVQFFVNEDKPDAKVKLALFKDNEILSKVVTK